jgi:capsular exopolysaccharide synthesis family protein
MPLEVPLRLEGQRAEAYRILRSNLSVALSDLERPTVIVTSAYAGEGKTSTTVNLAISLALSGRRVVLVDLDLRHADVHRWLGCHNEFGVSDTILDRRGLQECLQYVPVGAGPNQGERGLYLLATGPPVANPTELLGTQRTSQLLGALALQADVVLIDTPPVLLVADTLVIGRMVAGAILVVEARRTPAGVANQAKDALTRNQTRLLGVVLNKFQAKDAPDSGYGYGYGYGYASTGREAGELDSTGNGNAGQEA